MRVRYTERFKREAMLQIRKLERKVWRVCMDIITAINEVSIFETVRYIFFRNVSLLNTVVWTNDTLSR
jgi:hypothetical protein